MPHGFPSDTKAGGDAALVDVPMETLDTKKGNMKTDETSSASDVIIGTEQVLTQKFSLISMLALAFCVLGTWSTFAQDLGSGLSNGGPITILWGLCLVFFCNICVAVSLGELCSAMPTALGQAYWVHRVWETDTGRVVSYMTAWINTFGWWTLTASQTAFMSEFILATPILYHPWAAANKGWVLFLTYLGITWFITVANMVACRKDWILPQFNNFVGICFGGLFVIISLALLISVGTKPGLQFQPASFALGGWLNSTGWPNGVVWFTGLVQGAYGLTAFDSVIHMVEEIPQPRKNAPRAIWLAVVCGAVSGFLFMVVCLFCIQDLHNVLNSATGLPFMALLKEVLGLGGGVALLALFEFNGICQDISIATTSSRLTWGFARDGGLPWSRYFAYVDPKWKSPIRALWLQGLLMSLVGILYLFASTVLSAILATTTIALTVSYALPIVALFVVGRDKIPAGGQFHLGRLGYVVNGIGLVYCIITTIFFLFPGSPNPSASDMNYAIAVFGIMLVIAVGFWFINGRKTYLRTEDAELRLAQAMFLETHMDVE